MHHTIEVEKLSYSYPDGHVALREASLTIAPGEKVALVGPNGAGKSTLMLHLNGILQGPGSVRVCGLDVIDKNLGKVRAAVGLVFQNPDDQLFSPTVFDDVAFGPIYQGLKEGRMCAHRVYSGARRRAHARLCQTCVASPERGREEAHRHRHRAVDGPRNPGARRAIGGTRSTRAAER